jgi:hypothetical protein
MAAPVNELLAALQAAATADAVLVDLAGAEGFFDRPTRATRFPTVALSDVETRDWSTGTETGFEILLTLACWSERGRKQAQDMAEALRQVAEALAPELGDRRLVNLLHRRTTSRRDAKTGLFVAEVTFRAVVE